LLDATTHFDVIPLHVVIQSDDVRREVTISYAGPLRYPHLERLPNASDWLTPLLLAH
jgi:hypothetical protein